MRKKRGGGKKLKKVSKKRQQIHKTEKRMSRGTTLLKWRRKKSRIATNQRNKKPK